MLHALNLMENLLQYVLDMYGWTQGHNGIETDGDAHS